MSEAKLSQPISTLTPPPSPTGTPIISPALVPVLAAGLVALEAVSMALPEHTVASKVLRGAVPLLAALLGVMSPGWRKR